jgi:hypothetical protein
LDPAPYEILRRNRTSAPTPEAISARLAAKVTGNTTGGPPLLGSAVAVAVGLAVAVAVGLAVAVAVAVGLAVAVAVAVAVGLAVIPPLRCCSAKAAEESTSTSTALTANRSRIFFMKHPLYAPLSAPFFRALTHLSLFSHYGRLHCLGQPGPIEGFSPEQVEQGFSDLRLSGVP